MFQNNSIDTNMPLTLERHFKALAEQYSDVQDIHSLWLLLRKDLEDRLPHSRGIFVHYSLHDAIHSRSVIHAIERFLGNERIARLSATDTFMLLACAYAHDYGMAMTFNQIYDALGDPDFFNFLVRQQELAHTLGAEDVQAIKNILAYIQDKRVATDLQELYFSIMLLIQTYLRPSHWKGVEHVWGDFKGLLEGRLNGRFIQGGEGIIDICEAHGKSFQDVLKMCVRADGIVGDDFHPRFIAAMLRLGDLLDLDNGRFPRWFVTEIGRNRGIIPEMSILHYKKHEAINHLLITPKRIEVCASCNGEKGYEVAGLVQEWIGWLETECTDQILHWSEITQTDFGRPPQVTKREILLDGKLYSSENRKLQMRMSQDRVMKLLEGTSIYQDQYVGIRELVQNAVDASLLQLWYDITHNRYISLGISKHGHKISDKSSVEGDKMEMGLLEHSYEKWSRIFSNYSITIELIHDMVDQKVYVVVKDKGTGITPEDARYMSDIGTSKEKNRRVVDIMKNMPRWLKPAGVFGIGMQSAFQITNRIDFYTRRPNEPERLIAFHSYGRNHGKIEIREVPPDVDGVYNDNAVPGTNVKIAIDPQKLLPDVDTLSNRENQDRLIYYDAEFDTSDLLRAVFVEMAQVIVSKLRDYPYDYFNINFQVIEREKDDVPPKKHKIQRLRYSYFAPNMDIRSKDATQERINENSILTFYQKNRDCGNPFSFSEDMAYYFDEKSSRIYHLKIRIGELSQTGEEKCYQLPAPINNLYRIQYKFSPISSAETIYPPLVRQLRPVHAGFLEWDINIMDDRPDTYLNIDRDRLREGAIAEKELEAVRSIVLQRWCDYLIDHHRHMEQERTKQNRKGQAKLAYDGRESEFKAMSPVNPFEGKPRTLISLALLFYHSVPVEKFRVFIEPYEDFLKRNRYLLWGEDFPVDQLWETGKIFRTSILQPEWFHSLKERVSNNKEPAESCLMHKETINNLPHRLIHIYAISMDQDGRLTYYMRLGRLNQQICAIEMDYAARFHDYCNAIDADPSKKQRSNLDSLVRKVFKPNQEYPNLLVETYPKTFRRGRNFELPIDHCIRWYILSPFDRDMTMRLRNAYKDSRGTEQVIADFMDGIPGYVAHSEQVAKCVRYVCKQRTMIAEAMGQPLSDHLEQDVRREYTTFLKDCCQILIEQKDLIIDQFRMQKLLL